MQVCNPAEAGGLKVQGQCGAPQNIGTIHSLVSLQGFINVLNAPWFLCSSQPRLTALFPPNNPQKPVCITFSLNKDGIFLAAWYCGQSKKLHVFSSYKGLRFHVDRFIVGCCYSLGFIIVFLFTFFVDLNHFMVI